MMKTTWTGFFLLTLTLGAAEPELYVLTKRSEVISERGTVDRWAWRTENAFLSLIPPGDWGVAVKPQEKKLALRSLPFLSGISIRVATNTPGSFPNWATAEALRDQI